MEHKIPSLELRQLVSCSQSKSNIYNCRVCRWHKKMLLCMPYYDINLVYMINPYFWGCSLFSTFTHSFVQNRGIGIKGHNVMAFIHHIFSHTFSHITESNKTNCIGILNFWCSLNWNNIIYAILVAICMKLRKTYSKII